MGYRTKESFFWWDYSFKNIFKYLKYPTLGNYISLHVASLVLEYSKLFDSLFNKEIQMIQVKEQTSFVKLQSYLKYIRLWLVVEMRK